MKQECRTEVHSSFNVVRLLVVAFAVVLVTVLCTEWTAGAGQLALSADMAFSAIESQSDPAAESAYGQGTKALDERRWSEAVQQFEEVIRLKNSRADGALYWKAFAQNKQGQRTEALAALATLGKSFPQSRWLTEARALEIEIRQASGQPVRPENEADEDLKLIAINSLMQTDAERALPLLEKILQGSHPGKLKERALFVLAQNSSPKARDLINRIARDSANPELQMKALHNLGIFGGKESRQTLADIYGSSTDLKVKRAVLHSYMIAGERERLLNVAKTEQSPELRGEAIQQLGVLGANAELWQMYQAESSIEIKEKILHALFVGGNSERIIELAKTEKDPKLKRAAIHTLGVMGAQKTGETLVSLYASEKDPAIRRQALQGLFVQSNVKALIDLARKESDPAMKKEIVNFLSLMRSDEAVDYLTEILNK